MSILPCHRPHYFSMPTFQRVVYVEVTNETCQSRVTYFITDWLSKSYTQPTTNTQRTMFHRITHHQGLVLNLYNQNVQFSFLTTNKIMGVGLSM